MGNGTPPRRCEPKPEQRGFVSDRHGHVYGESRRHTDRNVAGQHRRRHPETTHDRNFEFVIVNGGGEAPFIGTNCGAVIRGIAVKQ